MLALGRSAVERRKVRKGTFSCLECKNRKTRCEFKSASSSVCSSCQLRRLPCISQECADTGNLDYEEVEKRIDHVEALFGQLVGQKSVRNLANGASLSSQGTSTSACNMISKNAVPGIPNTPSPLSAEAENNMRQAPPSLQTAGQMLLNRSCSLSGYLDSILPHPTIAMRILSRGQFLKLPTRMLRQPLRQLAPSSTGAEQLTQVCRPLPLTAHPVLFARKLIQLALCLQQLDAATREQPELRLNESAQDAARRYIDAAIHLTSQDLLMDSLEGLEVLMLEGAYHVNVGNSRVAWLIIRRALGIAELMGFPQLAEKMGSNAEFTWFRLIYSERFLSLVLGLPFAVSDNSFASEQLLAASTPSERLGRLHVVVAGRIITRNLHMQRGRHYKGIEKNAYDDHKETQDVDHDLKQAARSLPAKWWVLPTLDNAATDVETMEMTASLVRQMHQYYLLVLLHQPYFLLMHCLQRKTCSDMSLHRTIDCTYSEAVVLSASRELLSRFSMIRSFHTGISYRGLDDKAFPPSVALLLAHMDGHRLGRANVLEHQRPHDLGIIQSVIDSMKDISHSSNDVSSSPSVQILRKLVEIEADAADGANYDTWIEDGDVRNEDSQITTGQHSLDLPIPYFGTIRVARQTVKRAQLAGFDPDTARMPSGHNSCDVNEGNFLVIDPTINDCIPVSNSQLQPSVPTLTAPAFDDNLMGHSYLCPPIQDLSQPSMHNLHDLPSLEGAVDASNQDVDDVFFSTFSPADAATDETLIGTEMHLALS